MAADADRNFDFDSFLRSVLECRVIAEFLFKQRNCRTCVIENNGSLGSVKQGPHGVVSLTAGGHKYLTDHVVGELQNRNGCVVIVTHGKKLVGTISKHLLRKNASM